MEISSSDIYLWGQRVAFASCFKGKLCFPRRRTVCERVSAGAVRVDETEITRLSRSPVKFCHYSDSVTSPSSRPQNRTDWNFKSGVSYLFFRECFGRPRYPLGALPDNWIRSRKRLQYTSRLPNARLSSSSLAFVFFSSDTHDSERINRERERESTYGSRWESKVLTSPKTQSPDERKVWPYTVSSSEFRYRYIHTNTRTRKYM